jgi:hypothetical protein
MTKLSSWRAFTVVLSASVLVVTGLTPALGAPPPDATASSGQGPVEKLADQPFTPPATAAPEEVPAVQRPADIRSGSVSDSEYAAEKEAAVNAPTEGGPAPVPVPPKGGGAAQAPTVATNFAGLNRQTAANNGLVFNPPDTILGKSPSVAVEAVNSAIRTFTNTGTVTATTNLNTFFGSSTASGRFFDPKVYYDRNATNPRVYVIGLQQTGRGNTSLADNVSRMWLAISRGPNPTNLTSNWCRYNIDTRSEIGTSTESWGDYPSLGVGRDSLNLTINNFRFDTDAFRFARIHTLDKTVAANNAGSCPTIPRFIFQPSATAGNFGLFTIQPAQSYTSPSSGAGTTNPAYFLSTTRGTSNQYHVHRIRNVASGSPTYTRVTLTGTGYGIPPSGSQPGTTTRIDSGDNRMLQVAGIGNTLVGQLTTVCNFTAGTPNESCTLTPRVSVGISGTGALTASMPENNFVGFTDNIFVHHPSIATDTSLRSGATWEFNGPSDRLSSAAMSKVVNANWSGVLTYAPGNCSYTGATARSGDYSGGQLDPGLTGFWLAGEQAITIGGSCQWQTRVVRLNP